MNEPLITDKHDAIANAVLRLAARKGLDYVSLRHVAQEANVSMGQIQYYFGTTNELLYYSIKRIVDRLGTIAAARMQQFPVSDDPLDPLHAFVDLMVTDDPELMEIMRVLGQYEARLEKDPRIGGLLAREDPTLQAGTIAIFANAMAQGVLPATIDPAKEAQLFWVILGSLSVEIALGSSTVARGRHLMGYYISRMRVSGAAE